MQCSDLHRQVFCQDGKLWLHHSIVFERVASYCDILSQVEKSQFMEQQWRGGNGKRVYEPDKLHVQKGSGP